MFLPEGCETVYCVGRAVSNAAGKISPSADFQKLIGKAADDCHSLQVGSEYTCLR
jgi:hypothetical protein